MKKIIAIIILVIITITLAGRERRQGNDDFVLYLLSMESGSYVTSGNFLLNVEDGGHIQLIGGGNIELIGE